MVLLQLCSQSSRGTDSGRPAAAGRPPRGAEPLPAPDSTAAAAGHGAAESSWNSHLLLLVNPLPSVLMKVGRNVMTKGAGSQRWRRAERRVYCLLSGADISEFEDVRAIKRITFRSWC